MKNILDNAFVKYYSQQFEESKYPYEPYKKLLWDKFK